MAIAKNLAVRKFDPSCHSERLLFTSGRYLAYRFISPNCQQRPQITELLDATFMLFNG